MASLNHICYENITENFCHANLFGLQLIVDQSTGYFNATKLCEFGGKSFKKWYRKSSTKSLVKFIKKNQIDEKYLKYEISFGGRYSKISGTYLHQYFLLKLSEWVSHNFYCKSNELILYLSERHFHEQILEKENTNYNLRKMIKEMTEKINFMDNTN